MLVQRPDSRDLHVTGSPLEECRLKTNDGENYPDEHRGGAMTRYDFIERYLDRITSPLIVTTLVLFTIFLVTFVWDSLAWLTNNQDNWRNTGFFAPLICFLLWVGLLLLLELLLWIIIATHSVGNFVRRRVWGNDKEEPPSDRYERHLWANRMPPYDK